MMSVSKIVGLVRRTDPSIIAREPETSDPRQFGPKTLRHYFGGSELSGHFGTGAEVIAKVS